MNKIAIASVVVLVAAAWTVASADGPAAAAAAGKSAATQPASRPVRRTVFAAPFENTTKQEQYDPAAAGMGDLVAILLAEQENIRIVERMRLLALTAEQARSLKGLTGGEYAIQAGKLLRADTVLTGRLYLVETKLTVAVKALEIATARVVATAQTACRPEYLPEAALQLARSLAKQMALPLPPIDLARIDKSPIAGLHFAKALSHFYAGNMDSAIMQFMRTMDLDPDYVEAHYWCGLAYMHLHEDTHAIVEWEKLLKRKPDHEEVKLLLAAAKKRLGPMAAPSLGPKVPPDKAGSGARQPGKE